MPTPVECVCCQEIAATASKSEASVSGGRITDHEGFSAVCLNVWVLQAGFFSYRYHYGTRDVPTHECTSLFNPHIQADSTEAFMVSNASTRD